MTTDTTTPSDYIEKNSPLFIKVAFALFLGGFATFALLYCVQPMMPVFSKEFSVSASESSLLISMSTFMLAFGLLLTGPISDAMGRKSIMIIALLLSSSFTLLSAIVHNWQLLLICRALVGISLSGVAAVAMAYLNEEIAPRHLGVAMGLYIGGNAIGGMSGRLISGVLIDFYSWHIVLGIMSFLALICAISMWKLLPPSKHFEPMPIKFSKLLNGYLHHIVQPRLPWLFFQGFLLMGAFVTLFNYIAYRLIAPPYLLSQAWIGVLSIVYLSGIFSSTTFGSWADRFGHARVLWIAVVIMLSGALITLFTPITIVFIGMVIFALGFFGAHSVTSSWIGRCATKAKGQASSFYLFCYYIGSSVLGTAGGHFWQSQQWNGVIGYIATILIISLLVALYLKRQTLKRQ